MSVRNKAAGGRFAAWGEQRHKISIYPAQHGVKNETGLIDPAEGQG